MHIVSKSGCGRFGLSWRARLLSALLIFLTTSFALAEDENKPDPDPLELARSSVTRSLNYLTKILDAFFGDNREFEDSIGSWARVNLQARVQEKTAAEYNSSVQIRIALPRTAARFNIV